MDTAKVFWSGHSQAVRLPRAFRVDAGEVRIRRRGRATCWNRCPSHGSGSMPSPATSTGGLVLGSSVRTRERLPCPKALIHDMRRLAVRTFERAGVPRSAAMSMVGHKTESIYRRYAIVDEAMQREAGARLDAFTAAPQSGQKMARVRTFKARQTALRRPQSA